jgi:hypothetical protein
MLGRMIRNGFGSSSGLVVSFRWRNEIGFYGEFWGVGFAVMDVGVGIVRMRRHS